MGIEKRRNRIVNEKTALITVDVGKRVHYASIRHADGLIIPSFPFENTRAGFNLLFEKAQKFQDQNGLSEIVLGFESTGPYAESLCSFMKARGAKLVQVNPMHTKKVKELSDNSPEKSDRKDPHVIADLILMNRALSVIIPEGWEAELRRLVQTRENLVQNRTRLTNRLQNRLALSFPEITSILDSKTKSAHWLLLNYPSPEAIVALGEEELMENLKRISRGNLKGEKVRQVYAAAEASIGITAGKRGLELEIGLIIGHIRQFEESIAAVESAMAQTLKALPYAEYLLSIRGIGTVIAATLIGEIGNVENYRNAESVVKLAGLNLYSISSGKHAGKHHITKRGRGLLRKALYYATMSMVRKNGIFYERYEDLRTAGKCRMVALTILSRKLLKIVFAIMRDKVEYQPMQATA